MYSAPYQQLLGQDEAYETGLFILNLLCQRHIAMHMVNTGEPGTPMTLLHQDIDPLTQAHRQVEAAMSLLISIHYSQYQSEALEFVRNACPIQYGYKLMHISSS